MPCLFEVFCGHPDDSQRIWLVVASDAGEAGKYVPDPYRPLGCQAIAGNARGPARLIGWVGPSRLTPGACEMAEPPRRNGRGGNRAGPG